MRKNVDILHWNERLKKRSYLPSKMVLEFQFSQDSYFVAEEGNFYYVCIMHEDKPYVVYRAKNEGNPPGSIALEFRKNFKENNITKEDILEFIDNPISYEKKRGR